MLRKQDTAKILNSEYMMKQVPAWSPGVSAQTATGKITTVPK